MAPNHRKPKGRPRVFPLKPVQLTVCTTFLQEVGPGIRHKCHKRDAAGNLISFANDAEGDGKLAQRVAAKVLKDNVDDDGKGCLATGGRPRPFSLGRIFN